jgi:hypothetical protein
MSRCEPLDHSKLPFSPLYTEGSEVHSVGPMNGASSVVFAVQCSGHVANVFG